MPTPHEMRKERIDRELENPIHQGEYDRLTEALRTLKSNRKRHPAGLAGAGLCYCAQYEQHSGRCLGAECYCH
jgi:hypothetical protein